MAIPLQLLETQDELAALPLRSLIREMAHAQQSGGDIGGVWEKRRAGWQLISGGSSQCKHTAPALPARLLWHPKWRELMS